jgi:hypothetical protein
MSDASLAPSPSGGRLAVGFAVLPPAQALLAWWVFPIFWALAGTFEPHNSAGAAAHMARVTGVIGLFATLVAVPVVLLLLRRGEATLQRLLIVGVALGNLPFAMYLGLLIRPTLMHLMGGTLGNHLVPVSELLMAGARVVALGSIFGVLSAGLFWILAIRPSARR